MLARKTGRDTQRAKFSGAASVHPTITGRPILPVMVAVLVGCRKTRRPPLLLPLKGGQYQSWSIAGPEPTPKAESVSVERKTPRSGERRKARDRYRVQAYGATKRQTACSRRFYSCEIFKKVP